MALHALHSAQTQPKLLTRDDFRAAVFARDGHVCVVCRDSESALDAHHIIERRLFPDGGYYVDNGATVCEEHHLLAEQTVLSCDELRARCGIKTVVLPPHLYDDNDFAYDKWGKPCVGQRRLRGDLFYDVSVQRILAAGGVLPLFDTAVVKYPRTMHLPWSLGPTKDDRVLNDTRHFEGREVVVTLKLDGENTSIYRDRIHARSVDGESHPSQAPARALQGRIGFELPDLWRIVVENVYAIHSIRYDDLASFTYMISVWNERNVCLSWDETVEYAALFDIPAVPEIWRGAFDRAAIERAYSAYADGNEGYVVRSAESFGYGAFRLNVAKWVRPNHIAVHNQHRNWHPTHTNALRAH
jgi:hypothetical protein